MITMLTWPQTAARKLGSDERTMDLPIDTRDRRQQRRSVRLPCAILRKGFIHVRKGKREIAVSLSSTLAKCPAIARAIYAIAEINPKRTFLVIERDDRIAIVFHANWQAARETIRDLTAESGSNKEGQTAVFRHSAEPLPEMLEDPEKIVCATLNQYAHSKPEFLARTILEQLWESGYDVRPKRG